MVPSYLLALREGLEAALIIGIVLGALRKYNRSALSSIVWAGVISATLVSIAVAFVLYRLGASLEGAAEEIFEGITMFLAAGVLTWMIFWMHRQARTIKSELEANVRRAATNSGKGTLFSLAFLAVVREGVELALFLTAAAYATDSQQTVAGTLLGLGTAALFGWSLFATTVRLDLRRFFQVTGVLLILFAAGLVAHGVHELNEVGWIPAIVEHVWDINFVLNEDSFIGQLLKALFGYNGNPSLTEVLAYFGYFVVIVFSLNRNQVRLPATQET
ncbi:MAG TPA: iron uptake transporter permease EfeU [Anaerolineales bacterium]|nr:iron uptake transporter permease EfeU [Anaerolineales bacterium]